jgi:hypothetical protein
MLFHEFYTGVERPVPRRPVVAKEKPAEKVDEGEAVQEGWVRGERDEEEFDLDLDG